MHAQVQPDPDFIARFGLDAAKARRDTGDSSPPAADVPLKRQVDPAMVREAHGHKRLSALVNRVGHAKCEQIADLISLDQPVIVWRPILGRMP